MSGLADGRVSSEYLDLFPRKHVVAWPSMLLTEPPCMGTRSLARRLKSGHTVTCERLHVNPCKHMFASCAGGLSVGEERYYTIKNTNHQYHWQCQKQIRWLYGILDWMWQCLPSPPSALSLAFAFTLTRSSSVDTSLAYLPRGTSLLCHVPSQHLAAISPRPALIHLKLKLECW